nr:MAG TPA: YvrJ protein family protein [Caudoviricetes sp.]
MLISRYKLARIQVIFPIFVVLLLLLRCKYR